MLSRRLEAHLRVAFPAREAIAHTNPWMTLLPYWKRLWVALREARSELPASGSSR